MPSSNHNQISKIMDLVTALNPQSVLDIGVGFGKYGVLCREYLELWDGREDYKKFLRKIDGIEAFTEYLTPLHEFIYNKIYIGNALDVLGQLDGGYDLVLLIDVLEHFDKKDGEILIKKILSRSKGMIISIPKDIGVQEDVFCNPYEQHKASWTKKELSRFGEIYSIYDTLSHIVYIGRRDEIKNIKKKHPLKIKIKEVLLKTPVVVPIYRFIKKLIIRK